MANNKLIFECKTCGQIYCGECSTNEYWQNFCSKECEDIDKEEKEKEKTDGKDTK